MRWKSKGKPRSEPCARRRTLVRLAALLILAGSVWIALSQDRAVPVSGSAGARPCLVIDAGHGGIDGGAVAFNGVKESDLNLSIALKLRDLAEFFGVGTRMTRQDDSRRTDILQYSEHEDLVHRTQLVNGVENGVLFSIHQNCYPTSQPYGAQVLYGSGAESRRLGELTHALILSNLQPENRRVAEPASDSFYLTAHAACPAILVECGFVSNLSELQRLCDESYQRSLAAVLLCAFLQFTATAAG